MDSNRPLSPRSPGHRSPSRALLLGLALLAIGAGLGIACIDTPEPPSGITPDAATSADSAVNDADVPGEDASVTTDGGPEGDAGLDAGPLDGGDAGPFEVTSLQGLRLWLESTKNLNTAPGGAVASWGDSAPHDPAVDGGVHIAVPSGVNPPGLSKNGFGGRPTVSFVNGNGKLQIANHPDFEFGKGDFLIAVVAKVASGSGSLWTLRPGTTGGPEELLSGSGLCVEYGRDVTNGCTSPSFQWSTDPHVFVGRRRIDEFTFRVDGQPQAKLDRGTEPPNIVIHDYQQAFAYLGGETTVDLSEVVIVVGPMLDLRVLQLEKHLKDKYLIP